MIYNPLKAHIVEYSDDTFAIRKLTITGWKYYDNQKMKADDYWWCEGVHQRWWIFSTLAEAQAVFNKLTTKHKKLRITRIYT